MNPEKFKYLVELALEEDIGKGDITAQTVCSDAKIHAVIVSKGEGVIAGLEIAKLVFMQISGSIDFREIIKDGEKVRKNQIIAHLEGKARDILTSERTALNFLNHLSGIATLTSQYVEKVKSYGCKILDTRKTTPALRELEKYAVRMGGGNNHRKGLYDMVLIKDNHLKLMPRDLKIKKMLSSVKKKIHKGMKIEIEVDDLKQLKQIYSSDIDIVMLDNMSISDMKKAASWVKSENAKSKKNVLLEASGRINLSNVEEIAKTGVDFISIGEITHSAPSFDTSLEIISSKK
jgi:nicotinate-nucleotide pyrophosphorylase (carboxylating)